MSYEEIQLRVISIYSVHKRFMQHMPITDLEKLCYKISSKYTCIRYVCMLL